MQRISIRSGVWLDNQTYYIKPFYSKMTHNFIVLVWNLLCKCSKYEGMWELATVASVRSSHDIGFGNKDAFVVPVVMSSWYFLSSLYFHSLIQLY